MKKKYLLSTSLAFILAGISLTSCLSGNKSSSSSKEETISSLDYNEEYTYDWQYKEPFQDKYDSFMNVDGYLNEDIWENRKWLHHSQKGVEISVTTYFTKYGVYIGAIAKDRYIQWTASMNFFANSGFWFQVKTPEVNKHYATAVQDFFFDAKNGASRNLSRFAGKTSLDKPLDNNPTQMTCEVFLSWDALNVTIPEGQDYPDFIRINPHYRYIEGIGSSNNDWIRPLFFFDDDYSNQRQQCAGRFGVEGYKNADDENSILGDAKNGLSKSDGWDLSGLDFGSIKSDGPHSQAIFFKDIYSEAYVFSVKMKVVGGIDSPNPRSGICNAIDEVSFDTFHLNGDEILDGNSDLTITNLSLYNNGVAGWKSNTLTSVKRNNAEIFEFICIKNRNVFYYILNGKFVCSQTINHLTGASCPGLYTLSGESIFFDFKATDLSGNNQDNKVLNEISKYANPIILNQSTGGDVTSSAFAANSGEGVTLTFTSQIGYILSDLEIPGTEINMEYFLNNAVDGKLFIPNIQAAVDVRATFSLYDGPTTTVTGYLFDMADNKLDNVEYCLKPTNGDPRLYFSGTAGGTGGFRKNKIPCASDGLTFKGQPFDGKYDVYVIRDGYETKCDDYIDTVSSEAKNFKADFQKMAQLMTRTFENGHYTYTSGLTQFRLSSYWYFSEMSDTAVFSVDVTSLDSISTYGNWDYVCGIAFTQKDVMPENVAIGVNRIQTTEPNNYRGMWTNNGEFISGKVGISSRTGVRSCMGPAMSNQQPSNDNVRICDSSIGGANPIKRNVTLVLYKNHFYTYIDNVAVYDFAVDGSQMKFSYNPVIDGVVDEDTDIDYGFKKDKPFMFGVSSTNTSSTGIKFSVVEALYGDDALNKINSSYSSIKSK